MIFDVQVYSTCSIHTEENEEVVATILASVKAAQDLAVEGGGGGGNVGGFELSTALPQWHRRGYFDRPVPADPLSQEAGGGGGGGSSDGASGQRWAWADRLVRCQGPTDHTNGFFVAVFDRVLPEAEPDAGSAVPAGVTGSGTVIRCGNEEMINPCLIDLRVISLVAQV